MEKNKKLDENRAKRIEKEKTAKEENQGKEGTKAGGSRPGMDIHPSRLALLPNLSR
jgi:nucleolar protein 6